MAITTANTKLCSCWVQRIAFFINQVKGNIKNYMWQYHQHIVQKYHTSYILISFKILFLNIYLICYWQSSYISINSSENILVKCFYQYLYLLLQNMSFRYQRTRRFKQDICSSPGNWASISWSFFCHKKFLHMLKLPNTRSILGTNLIFPFTFIKAWLMLIQSNA